MTADARTTEGSGAPADRPGEPVGNAHLTTPGRPARLGPARRAAALTRMELRLLGRNKTALFTAIAFAPLMVFAFLGVIDSRIPAGAAAQFSTAVLTTLLAFAVLFAVYYNLTTVAVARREELMLKRFSAGEATRGELLVAMATPGAVVVVAQAVLTAVVLGATGEPVPVTNPVLLVLTVLGAVAAFALLGYASSGLTRSVESAQLTTLPVFGAAIALSGIFFPLDALPTAAQRVAELTPLAPVGTLMDLATLGVGPDGTTVDFAGSFAPAALPLAVLVAWVVVGTVATRRLMRWEPRR